MTGRDVNWYASLADPRKESFTAYIPPRWRSNGQKTACCSDRSEENNVFYGMDDEMYAAYVRRHMMKPIGRADDTKYTFVYSFETPRSNDTTSGRNGRKNTSTPAAAADDADARSKQRTKKDDGKQREKQQRNEPLSERKVPGAKTTMAVKAARPKRDAYERSWTSMKSAAADSTIAFEDIYWPLHGKVKKTDGLRKLHFEIYALKSFLLGAKSARGNDPAQLMVFKKRVRTEQVRWHQDKFMQMFGGRLRRDDQVTILEAVNSLSSSLNDLWNAVR